MFNRTRRRVRRGRDDFSGGELARREKNRFLTDFTTRDYAAGSSEIRQGVAVAGESLSPRPHFVTLPAESCT